MAYRNYFIDDPEEMRRKMQREAPDTVTTVKAPADTGGVYALDPYSQQSQQGTVAPLPPTKDQLPSDQDLIQQAGGIGGMTTQDISEVPGGQGASATGVLPGQQVYEDVVPGADYDPNSAYYGTYQGDTDQTDTSPHGYQEDRNAYEQSLGTQAGAIGADNVGGAPDDAQDGGGSTLDIYAEDGSIDPSKLSKYLVELGLRGWDTSAEQEAARAAHEATIGQSRADLAARAGRFGGGGFSAALQGDLANRGALALNQQLAGIKQQGFQNTMQGARLAMDQAGIDRDYDSQMALIAAMKDIMGGGAGGTGDGGGAMDGPQTGGSGIRELDAATFGESATAGSVGMTTEQWDEALGNGWVALKKDANGNPIKVSRFGQVYYINENGQVLLDAGGTALAYNPFTGGNAALYQGLEAITADARKSSGDTSDFDLLDWNTWFD